MQTQTAAERVEYLVGQWKQGNIGRFELLAKIAEVLGEDAGPEWHPSATCPCNLCKAGA